MISSFYDERLRPATIEQRDSRSQAIIYGCPAQSRDEVELFLKTLNKEINSIPLHLLDIFFNQRSRCSLRDILEFSKVENLNPLAFFLLPISAKNSWETLATAFISLLNTQRILLPKNPPLLQQNKNEFLLLACYYKQPKAAELALLLESDAYFIINQRASLDTIKLLTESIPERRRDIKMHLLLKYTIEYHQDPKILEYLIKKALEENPYVLNTQGILGHAAIFGSKESAKLLLKYGASVNLENQSTYTPLLLAILNDNTETALLFLDPKYGANLENLTRALNIAKKKKNNALIRELDTIITSLTSLKIKIPDNIIPQFIEIPSMSALDSPDNEISSLTEWELLDNPDEDFAEF